MFTICENHKYQVGDHTRIRPRTRLLWHGSGFCFCGVKSTHRPLMLRGHRVCRPLSSWLWTIRRHRHSTTTYWVPLLMELGVLRAKFAFVESPCQHALRQGSLGQQSILRTQVFRRLVVRCALLGARRLHVLFVEVGGGTYVPCFCDAACKVLKNSHTGHIPSSSAIALYFVGYSGNLLITNCTSRATFALGIDKFNCQLDGCEHRGLDIRIGRDREVR